MNDEIRDDFEGLADAWSVETTDLTARVAAAMGAAPDTAELIHEMRQMRSEMEELRRSVLILQSELLRLRTEPMVRGMTRLSPYSPTESLVRLS